MVSEQRLRSLISLTGQGSLVQVGYKEIGSTRLSTGGLGSVIFLLRMHQFPASGSRYITVIDIHTQPLTCRGFFTW